MRKTLVVASVGALAAGAMMGGATIALAQADVIKERQENRKQTAAAMRAIKGIIDAKGPDRRRRRSRPPSSRRSKRRS